ncbi:hypothetical protein [Aromatoleum tolulyticum]|uniref:hypothetical protein n=1 Tax=Aromatoleum tolulyticum TaxID=34027 RepID=UPI0011154B64|nr:hypothetical protein [Aromatoleum tolulyticum]
MFEPVTTSLIYAAAMVHIATARPAWEPRVGNAPEIVLQKGNFTARDAEAEGIYKVDNTRFPSAIDRIISELDYYASFQDDWDGEGACSPSRACVHDSKEFINAFPAGLALPTPTISSEGEIGFYWSSTAGYIDLRIEGGGRISLYTRDRRTGRDAFEDAIDWRAKGRGWYVWMLSVLSDQEELAA